MTQVTPTYGEVLEQVLYQQEIDKGKRARKHQYHLKKIMEAHEWMITEHWFQYMHGNHKIGGHVRMLGSEAKRRNRILERKFFKDHAPDARLGHWFWLGKKGNGSIVDKLIRENDIGERADDE